MKLLRNIIASILIIAVTVCRASVIPIVPTVPTTIPTWPAIVTAGSNQVLARNFNRVYVPGTYVAHTPFATTTTYAATYPNNYYRYGNYYPYGYYPAYGYGYGYTSSVW